MKKRIVVIIVICAFVIAAVIAGILIAVHLGTNNNEAGQDVPDEGTAEKIESSGWHSARDNKEHSADSYTPGKTAERIINEIPESFAVNHKMIDDVPLYEMYKKDIKDAPILVFLHGQLSRKEENLDEMTKYAEAGYFCVTVDLQGHGERITNEALMNLEITKDTASDIDLILDYYDASGLANTKRFALIGFSQGGSVAYWYAAYGERTPCALIVGSTSPDYNYVKENKCIVNGAVADSNWSDKEVKDFIAKYNPIKHADKMKSLPILSANSTDDNVVSYKGSESLEKLLKQGGNTEIQFYYYENAGHNVTEDFVSKILPFIRQHLESRED